MGKEAHFSVFAQLFSFQAISPCPSKVPPKRLKLFILWKMNQPFCDLKLVG